MDKQYIDRYLVIDRYLAGDLADSEQADFEERLVWDQALIEELDLAEKLRDGIRASADQDEPGNTAPRSVPSRGVAWNRPFAMAASFLIGVMATAFLLNQPGVSPGDSNISTTVYPLDVLRGSGAQVVPVDPDGITVLLVAVANPDATYNVNLRASGDRSVIWSKAGMVASFANSVAISIHGSVIPPGEYELSLEFVLDPDSGTPPPSASSDTRIIPFETVLSN